MSKKLLVVEDDPQLLKGLVRFLSDRDYEVTAMSSPVGVEEVFGSLVLDLAVFDMNLVSSTDGGGLILARKLAGNIPIIIYSASDLPSGEVLPANVYYSDKWAGPLVLLDLIEDLLKDSE